MGSHLERSSVSWVLHRSLFVWFTGGFLRYASPAAPGGFGPKHTGVLNTRRRYFVCHSAHCLSGRNHGNRWPIYFFTFRTESLRESPACRRQESLQ
jgi:hypothetical protein